MDATVRDLPAQRRKPSPLRSLFTVATAAALRRLYPCAITGLEHYTAAPATLAVSNHRRDSDGPLLGSVLLRRRDGRVVGPLPHFVAREDLFERGFLAHYLRHCPASLRPLVRMISLRWCLTGGGAYPLRRVHERRVAEVLRDVIARLGDLPAAEALRPRYLAAFATEPALDPRTATLAQLLRADEHRLSRQWYGYRHLQLAVFRRIKPHMRQVIDCQLDRLARLLERGELVILEPEGHVSHDGGVRRPQAVLHELVNRPARPVRVLPISLTYDTLTTGAARIFVDIQPELTGLGGLARRGLDERVMAAVRSGCRVTGAQLAAGFLLYQPAGERWSETAMIEHVHGAARRCRDAVIPIDPCLPERRTCELRTREILAWGRRAGFLAPAGSGQWRVIAPAAPPPWLLRRTCSLLDYLRTELLETVGEARARDLALLP